MKKILFIFDFGLLWDYLDKFIVSDTNFGFPVIHLRD